MKYISFKKKLIIILCSFTLFISLPITLFMIFIVNENIEVRAKSQAELSALKVIQSIDIKGMLDGVNANVLIGKYSKISSVNGVAIFSLSKKMLAYKNKSNKISLFVQSFEEEVSLINNEISIFKPIIINNSVIGYYFIIFNYKKITRDTSNQYFYLLVFMVLMMVLIFSVVTSLQKWLTLPINKMANQILDINTYKKYKEIPSSNNEMELLVNAFNQVFDMAFSRENKLIIQTKQLKKLVDVRTKQLFKKAHYDSLTKLPNRYLLVDRLHQAIADAKRSNSCIALLFLDLDRFKVINDNFGHQSGDQLLIEVSKRLKNLSRSGETVARLGGDEFVFLLKNINAEEDAARSAMRIIECFSEPFQLQEHLLHISTSVGISIFPQDGEDDKTLLKNADISMYHAKKKGPGSFSFYSDEINNASLERLAIETHLRSAIENKELKLVYQPQKRLKENCYRNAEALLRWENSEIGHVSPGVFIPIAEETGLIKKIDLWVISEVCKQIKEWSKQGFNNITIAINVSAGHLMSSSLFEHLKTEILINQIKAEQIEIEITEEVFVEQTERTIQTLHSIKEIGAKIAIDDFGTGYSSLQYIQDFPADTLKLDGMFISKLESDKASQGIVRSTIILAHSLDLELVAECVETQWQLDFLEKNGCDIIQGYYLSKPVHPSEIIKICNG